MMYFLFFKQSDAFSFIVHNKSFLPVIWQRGEDSHFSLRIRFTVIPKRSCLKALSPVICFLKDKRQNTKQKHSLLKATRSHEQMKPFPGALSRRQVYWLGCAAQYPSTACISGLNRLQFFKTRQTVWKYMVKSVSEWSVSSHLLSKCHLKSTK